MAGKTNSLKGVSVLGWIVIATLVVVVGGLILL
jgi:hypothetical protein